MAKRTVILTGNELVQFDEDDKAGAAITPGMIVNYNGSGDLVPHATAGGQGVVRLAIEREEMGGGLDTVYAIGDTVKVGVCPPGVRVNILIANGVNVAKGNFLEVGAVAGTFRVLAAGVAKLQAIEALNNTSGANARLRAVVL
jgi:hypothetical protein